MRIRDYGPIDRDAIMELYPRAFPEEDLLPLVRELLAAPEAFSLVADADGAIVGHIGFTACAVAGNRDRLSMLAPLAVDPDHQRRGIGKGLIAAGIERLEAEGYAKLLVLGDPAYYGQWGFAQESGITPPAIPGNWAPAWQSRELAGLPCKAAGRLMVPEFWDKPEYWS
ncbi:MAG: N-acetyltransferase [Pseudomonadota bacterium]